MTVKSKLLVKESIWSIIDNKHLDSKAHHDIILTIKISFDVVSPPGLRPYMCEFEALRGAGSLRNSLALHQQRFYKRPLIEVFCVNYS